MKKKNLSMVYCIAAALLIVAAVLLILKIITPKLFLTIYVIDSTFMSLYLGGVVDKLHKRLEKYENINEL